MKTFIIDSANGTKAYTSGKAPLNCGDSTRFSNEKEFGSLTNAWPISRLVEVWNNLPGVKPVRKFTSRATALRRIWTSLQALAPDKSTKAEIVIGLLKRPTGATLKQVMDSTGWQAHSVRAFISAQLCKKLDLKVTSIKREGERVYRIR